MAYDSIRRFEGFRDKAYRDAGGKWTIGYGQTQLNGRPVQRDDIMSREEADKAWGTQVAPYAVHAQKLLPNATPQQHEALTSIIYNYGIDSPRIARLSSLLTSGDQEAAKQYWLASNTVKGVPNESLTKRRAQEWAMFSGTERNGQEGGSSAPEGKQEEAKLSLFQRLGQHLTGDDTESEQKEDIQPVIAQPMAADGPDYRNTPFRRFIRRMGGLDG